MSKEFRIMLLSEKSGKHFSVKMSVWGVIMVVLFFVCLVGTTTFSLKNYLHVLQQKKDYKQRVDAMESDLLSLKQENREAVLYKDWADRIIFRRMHYEDPTGQGEPTHLLRKS